MLQLLKRRLNAVGAVFNCLQISALLIGGEGVAVPDAFFLELLKIMPSALQEAFAVDDRSGGDSHR